MVAVNPNIPNENAPSYLGLSKPLADIKPNLTASTAVSGITSIIDSAVNAYDQYTKGDLEDKMRSGVEAERQPFIGALEQVANIPVDKRLGAPGTDPYTRPITTTSVDSYPPVGSNNLIPGSVAAPVPAQLQQGVDQMATLALGGQQGKFRNTDYAARLTTLVQDLKSQHPGYAGYIDQKMEQIAGFNPTNKYISDLLQIANENQTLKRSDRDWALNELNKEDVQNMPGIATYVQNVAQGKVADPRAYAILVTNEWRSKEADFKRRALERADIEGNRKLEADQARDDITKRANDIIGSTFVSMGGVKSGGVNFADLKGIVDAIDAGKPPAGWNTESETALNSAAHNMLDSARDRLTADANTQVSGKRSIAQALGPSDTQTQVEALLNPLKQFVERIDKKDYGAAHRIAKNVSDIGTQTLSDMYNAADINMRTYVRASGAFSQLGPNAGRELLEKAVGNMGLLSKGVDTLVDVVKQRAATQIDLQDRGTPYTLDEAIAAMRKARVGVRNEGDNEAYKSVTDLPAAAAASKSSSPETKANIYNFAFGPGNENTLKRFAPDTLDANGKLIPGQMDVFNRMHKQSVVDDVWETNKSVKGTWDNFRVNSEKQFSDLFGDIIRNAVNVYNPNFKVIYDSDTNHVRIDYKDTFFVNPYQKPSPFGGAGNFGDSSKIAQQQRANLDLEIAKLNTGFDAMKRIIQKEGGDSAAINGYITSLINSQPNMETNDFLQRLNNAVIHSNKAKNPDASETKGGPSLIDNATDALNNMPPVHELLKKGFEKLGGKFPSLEDFTTVQPKPANPGQIQGTANAAHVSAEWGNPFSPSFTQDHTTTIKAPNGQDVRVNKVASEAFEGFLKELSDSGYNIKEIQGYNLRTKRNGGRGQELSQHAFGNAIDINPGNNPFGSRKNDLPPNVGEIAAKYGITWGGDWSDRYRDPMHFEYTGFKPKTNFAGYKEGK